MNSFSRLFIASLAVVLTTACSGGFETPASPSIASLAPPVQLSTVSESTLTSSVAVQDMPLNWELGEGCITQKPALPASFVGSAPASTRVLASGNEVWGLWSDPAYPEKESKCEDLGTDGFQYLREWTVTEHYLLASFVKQGNEWRYCQWSTLDHEVSAYEVGTCKDRH